MQTNTVTVKEQLNFVLLQPKELPARPEKLSILPVVTNPAHDSILASIFNERSGPTVPMALDFETKGDYTSEDSRTIGVGLADDRGSWYIDFRQSHPNTYRYIMEQLVARQIPLVGHNVFFDAGWPLRDFGIWLNWQHCTYALYKLLATEGFNNQQWGLKAAQKDLLLWKETNEERLDRWLIEHGFHSNISKKKKEGYYFYPNWNENGPRWISPRKSEMWNAPSNILGYYCALDADSTWLLYTGILRPALQGFEQLDQYCGPDYQAYIKLLIEQKLSGIQMHRPKLERYNRYLLAKIEQVKTALIRHPAVQPYIDHRHTLAIRKEIAKQPPQFKKKKEPPKEPTQFNKDGSLSRSWEKWSARINDALYLAPVLSKNWITWQEKYTKVLNTCHFNPNSANQKKELFYDFLYTGAKKINDETYSIRSEAGIMVELPATKSGGPPTDKKALKIFGPVGRLFLDYQNLVKEQQYVHACLMVMDEQNVIHPSFRVPGTLSGRLAGGGTVVIKDGEEYKMNIQQIPKTVGYLSCFIPRPGMAWIDCDHSAIEQVVLAELSKDPTLWKLYGPGAIGHDVYLFNGCSLPGIGDRIKAAGYNLDKFESSCIKGIKEKCKKERAVSKVVTLGSSYGMGAAKLRRTLMLEGIEVSLDEAKAIHRAYWNLYGGVKKYQAELERQYKRNDGWVLNGIGRPIGIDSQYLHDSVNRVIQSTAHDLHILYVTIVCKLLKEAGIQWKPIIVDFHDQMIVEVRAEDAECVKHLMGSTAYDILNQQLGGQIPIKGDANVIRNMAQAKCSKEDIEAYIEELGIDEHD